MTHRVSQKYRTKLNKQKLSESWMTMMNTTAAAQLLWVLLGFGAVDAFYTTSRENYRWVDGYGLGTGGRTVASTSNIPTHHYKSRNMGMWAEQQNAYQDVFEVKLTGTTATGQERTKAIQFGERNNQDSPRQYVPVGDWGAGGTLRELRVTFRCVDGKSLAPRECNGDSVRFYLGDCTDCPSGSIREKGVCSAHSTPSDTKCLSRCAKGHFFDGHGCKKCGTGQFQDESHKYSCKSCDVGTANGQTGLPFPCPKCAAGYYSDETGLAACKACPNVAMSVASQREGLTSASQCGSFVTTGIWQPAGTGSVAGQNPFTIYADRGVSVWQSVTVGQTLTEEMSETMSRGTNFETNKQNGWAVSAGVEIKDIFSAGMEFSGSEGTSQGETNVYALSESTSHSLSFSVTDSLVVSETRGCSQTCLSHPEVDSPTAYGYQWFHLVFDNDNQELIMNTATCNLWCLYSADARMQCPPGRCANHDCSVCLPGTFANETTDRIASTFPTESPTQAPSTSPSRSPSAVPTRSPSSAPTVSAAPSQEPSISIIPTASALPSQEPSALPSQQPSLRPTKKPSGAPSPSPTDPPTQAPTPAPSPPTVCFSAKSRLQRRQGDTVTMDQLQIGDQVWNGGTFDTVYSFAHKHTTHPSEFLQIHSAIEDDGKEEEGVPRNSTNHQPQPTIVELSGDHLVYLWSSKNDDESTQHGSGEHPVPSSSLKIGDRLVASSVSCDGKTTSPHKPAVIVNIQTVVRPGFYAPLTASGTIAVDGIVASNFVTLDKESPFLLFPTNKHNEDDAKREQYRLSFHDLMHLWMTPVRVWCLTVSSAYCQNETHDDDGYTFWASAGRDLYGFWRGQPSQTAQAIILGLVLVGLGAVRVVFIGLSTPASGTGACIIAALVVVTWFFLFGNKGTKGRFGKPKQKVE